MTLRNLAVSVLMQFSLWYLFLPSLTLQKRLWNIIVRLLMHS